MEFLVKGGPSGWTVKRGHTTALRYDSREAAVRAAENLARAASRTGETALVKVVDGQAQETRTFEPETRRHLDVAAGAPPRRA
jgi:hypothetical protein